MYTKKDIENVIDAYEQCGIVTRKECKNLDSRPLSQEIYNELLSRGYEEAQLAEIHLENFYDYSRVIYNSDRIDIKEVEKYMIKNVLGK